MLALIPAGWATWKGTNSSRANNRSILKERTIPELRISAVFYAGNLSG